MSGSATDVSDDYKPVSYKGVEIELDKTPADHYPAPKRQYTGIWPFRKLKKKTAHELLSEAVEELFGIFTDTTDAITTALEEVKEAVTEIKECVDNKLADAKVSAAHLAEVRERFSFLEATVSKLIDTNARAPQRHEEDKSHVSSEERERQQRLKERLIAKRNGGGFSDIDKKAANR